MSVDRPLPREERCAAYVSDPPHFLHLRLCSRPRGYGFAGRFCKQHSKQYPARAEAERDTP